MIGRIIFVLVLLTGLALADRAIEGRVTVVRDVDTIVVAGIPVRLNALDGPETVTCLLNGDRTHDHWIGVCFLDGQDIGAIAVANGHALDCARYSGCRYRGLETPEARSRI